MTRPRTTDDDLPTSPDRPTSPLPSGGGAFTHVLSMVAVELAAAEHERLCRATQEQFSYAGVVRLREKRRKALHARLRAELDAAQHTA